MTDTLCATCGTTDCPVCDRRDITECVEYYPITKEDGMKLSIDLDQEHTPDGEDTIGGLLRQVINDEVTAFVRAEVRR